MVCVCVVQSDSPGHVPRGETQHRPHGHGPVQRPDGHLWERPHRQGQQRLFIFKKKKFDFGKLSLFSIFKKKPNVVMFSLVISLYFICFHCAL